MKEADKSEELFLYLIIAQCNTLNEILLKMFPKINDCTEHNGDKIQETARVLRGVGA